MARAIGSLIPLNLALLAFAGAVALGAVVGGILVLFAVKGQPSTQAAPAAESSPSASPEPLKQVVLYSFALLVALDVLVFLYDGIRSVFSHGKPSMLSVEEDEFVPGLTTIPFGPYIVAATLIALIGKPYVLSLWDAYWRWATGGG